MPIESPWDAVIDWVLEPVNPSLVDKDQLRRRIKKALQESWKRAYAEGRRAGAMEDRQMIRDSL